MTDRPRYQVWRLAADGELSIDVSRMVLSGSVPDDVCVQYAGLTLVPTAEPLVYELYGDPAEPPLDVLCVRSIRSGGDLESILSGIAARVAAETDHERVRTGVNESLSDDEGGTT